MAFKKQRMGRKKVCYFTKNNITSIDYKDVELLKRFVSPTARSFHGGLPARVRSISACWRLRLNAHARWLCCLTLTTKL